MQIRNNQYRFHSLLILIILILLSSCRKVQGNVTLSPELNGDAVEVVLRIDKPITGTVNLYRSTRNFHHMDALDLQNEPIVKWTFPANSVIRFTDTAVPHNELLYYYCKVTDDGKTVHASPVKSVKTNPVTLPDSADNVAILIDKRNYVLSVMQDRIPLKRYAINLGSKPQNRKLHWDNRSTPEGFYSVSYFNENSSFHRSLGVSYPNVEDRKRYEKAKRNGTIPLKSGKPAGIGGSITIHGGGVWNNWTFGCIAMNNSDVDELMDCGIIKVGTPILIGGWEIPVDSLFR